MAKPLAYVIEPLEKGGVSRTPPTRLKVRVTYPGSIVKNESTSTVFYLRMEIGIPLSTPLVI